MCRHTGKPNRIQHFAHIVHRAPLGMYLRLQGIAVPAIYNDSADEKGGVIRSSIR
jgi:hypothetical protein